MTEQTLIRAALERYLAGLEPGGGAYRSLAERHRLLPILPDWNGFVGLREDGCVFWVSDEDGSASAEINAHVLHVAKIRGSELFPELIFLKPHITPDWVECHGCGGAGQVVIEGHRADGVRCYCGGLGKLPPKVAELLGRG
jgi:hypothetical protein